MTCKLFVAFTDGSIIEEELPNHELADTQTMCEETSKELYVAIELEDNRESIVFTYRKEITRAY
jgi:hypothetical protein